MRISDWSSDVCSSDRIFTQRQAERDRECLLPTKPDVGVAKADCTARLLCQVADEAVVQIDEQQCVLAAPGHQNSVSISEGWPFDRAASRNSRSKAARTARMVSSRVAGLPVSMREIVSWRRPVFSPNCVWLQIGRANV